jgi:hypothetical protein
MYVCMYVCMHACKYMCMCASTNCLTSECATNPTCESDPESRTRQRELYPDAVLLVLYSSFILFIFFLQLEPDERSEHMIEA